MTRLLIRWLINAGILYGLQYVLPGYRISQFGAALAAAAVLALVNFLIRPIVLVLTLPLNVLSLGLFTFVINAAMFALAAHFVRGFQVGGPFNAFFGSIIFGLVSWFLSRGL